MSYQGGETPLLEPLLDCVNQEEKEVLANREPRPLFLLHRCLQPFETDFRLDLKQKAKLKAACSKVEALLESTNRWGMKFVLIPAGSFQMGAASSDYNDERPVHHVTISQPFYLGKYQVTQREWREVMGNNPSYFKGDDLPVEQVSWEDVQEFIKKLNGGGDGEYRLPSEAEWEYACRAGTMGDYAGQLGEMGWYAENSGNQMHPVGQKKPNGWGLYDMHGNVWEWCQDWWDAGYYAKSPPIDPTGPPGGSSRVIRGGGWYYRAVDCRSASRDWGTPAGRNHNLGFRLVRTAL
ncbi:MAG: formylglycine-generating enzyme family protein [Blastocatellia bacterium]|nr:formylglycine-generating enzyme family protein [Blastocatellia bacterium]